VTNRQWSVGESFSLADCSAAPALFYADWTHPIGDAFPNVRGYRSRLNARPSFTHVIDEAVPHKAPPARERLWGASSNSSQECTAEQPKRPPGPPRAIASHVLS
jgi:hypothetical protein